MTIRSAIVAFAVALGGCQLFGPDRDVELSVDRAAYQRPDTIHAVLFNGSNRSFTVHPELCGSTLAVVGSADVIPLDEVCTAIGFELRPGAVLQAKRYLPATIPAGEYVLQYELSAESDVESGRFSVDAPAATE